MIRNLVTLSWGWSCWCIPDPLPHSAILFFKRDLNVFVKKKKMSLSPGNSLALSFWYFCSGQPLPSVQVSGKASCVQLKDKQREIKIFYYVCEARYVHINNEEVQLNSNVELYQLPRICYPSFQTKGCLTSHLFVFLFI